MGLNDFIKDAPCRESDSWLFDQTNLDLAQPALNICKSCPYWSECEALVEPSSSHYDGICGGKVWRNGKVLAKLIPASPNRLQVGDDLDGENDDAMAIRGSQLLGD
jgi:hypothetical protein